MLQTTFEYLFCAAISKMFAASVTYPYQVIRARLQDQHRNYAGAIDVLRQICRYYLTCDLRWSANYEVLA